ncbi:MAG: hypothetical protein HY220_01350 [Candidatus Sungbacteria bacterium]|uniref:Uncharacterized protein n=1 Tax=Candidatus Sungiibacteriota bacterium TaxID=2750080 RepID=A0A9D6QTX4_9BACT|nr:hypothetical protein [Candidatus Sungbacteria bacterium]
MWTVAKLTFSGLFLIVFSVFLAVVGLNWVLPAEEGVGFSDIVQSAEFLGLTAFDFLKAHPQFRYTVYGILALIAFGLIVWHEVIRMKERPRSSTPYYWPLLILLSIGLLTSACGGAVYVSLPTLPAIRAQQDPLKGHITFLPWSGELIGMRWRLKCTDIQTRTTCGTWKSNPEEAPVIRPWRGSLYEPVVLNTPPLGTDIRNYRYSVMAEAWLIAPQRGYLYRGCTVQSFGIDPARGIGYGRVGYLDEGWEYVVYPYFPPLRAEQCLSQWELQ